ncbi:hypothetical protein ACWDBO_30075 [Streptomyces mirabilis]|uniref:hypothetical protein n=1 Tax=Streptomyces mirabilis TaxID=68239 RepID=UPI003333DE7A
MSPLPITGESPPPRRPPGAVLSHTRLERVSASASIASLALQQIQDDLTADDIDAAELAAILRELIEDTDPPGGFLPFLAQLLTDAAQRAEHIEPDLDGDASCPLHEAAALVNENAGQRLIWAARALDPQGDPT